MAVVGIPSNELTVKLSEGTITGKDGKYTLNISESGMALMEVLHKGKLVRKQTYQVKRIPEPLV